jgi:16S rRNA (guanine(966)-N(2))-methyltransferase RsmD
MRIIAGKFRSRPLHALRGLNIRPTSDRLRETLFNVLTAGNPESLEGSVWVDLFAGTGAVGIEALSRGAEMVYFVESSKAASEVIRENLQSLGIKAGFRVVEELCTKAIPLLQRQRSQPDYVFIDPPYGLHKEYGATLAALGSSDLSARALVVAEHGKRFDPGEKCGSLRRTRKLMQGDAALSFYRRG